MIFQKFYIRIFGEAIFIYTQNGTIKELLNIHYKYYMFNLVLIIIALFTYIIFKKEKICSYINLFLEG